MHPAAMVSSAHPRYPVQAGGGYPAQQNPLFSPEGSAAVGALLGTIVGGGIGYFLARGVIAKAPGEIQVTAENATEGEFKKIMEAEKADLDKATTAYNRKVHAVSGIVSIIGAAVGAYAGAGNGAGAQAAMGAALGQGVIEAVNVMAGTAAGMPGLIAAPLGAYLGARQSGG